MKVDSRTLFFVILGVTVIKRPSSASKEPPHTTADMSNAKSQISNKLDYLSPADRTKLINKLENSLLNIFGFKKRPQIKKKLHIPQYMLDLYRTHVNDPEDIQLNFNRRGLSLENANIARSFYFKDTEKGYADKQTLKFIFNISSIPIEETVTAAELRVYRKELNISSDYNGKRYRLSIYEIIRPATTKREAITRLIDTKVINTRRTRWESFDVYPAVVRWREDTKSNHGLEVHLCNTDEHDELPSDHEVHRHVRLRRSVDQDHQEWLQEQPLLVTYSHDGKYQRSKRSTRRGRRRNRGRRQRHRKTSDLCRRHNLYVDFADVGWKDWIVAPPGYDAYFCEGECVFPIAEHYNATNHAVVQTLVNSVSPKAVPRACCVPTELSAISMLYLDDEQKVVLKNYQDMVVEGCGCR